MDANHSLQIIDEQLIQCFPQVFAMRKHLFKAMCLGENNVTF